MLPSKVDKPKKKRNRKCSVCVECRKKKIRCDRAQPCLNCVKAGLECLYVAPEGKEMLQPMLPTPKSVADETELTAQIKSLKKEVERLQAKNDQANSILDVKLSSIKKTTVLGTPESLIFHGPSSHFAPFFGQFTKYPLEIFMTKIYYETIIRESRQWLKTHDRTGNQLHKLYSGPVFTEEQLVEQINNIILPNVPAIQERLLYVQTDLNPLLYHAFMPMSMVLREFVTFFPESSTRFVPPRENYKYGYLALIVWLTYLAIIFTRYNSVKDRFLYKLTCDTQDLVDLGFTLIRHSNIMQNRTQVLLLVIVVIHSTLFDYNSTEIDIHGTLHGTTAYPVFQLLLNMCFQMGMHRDLNGSKDRVYVMRMPQETRNNSMSHWQCKSFWNYMQLMDATYSQSLGTPLLIDYNYCDGLSPLLFSLRHDQKWLDGLNLLRHNCKVMNSVHDISINEAVSMVDALIDYCKQNPIEAFQVNPSSSDINGGLAFMFHCKLIMLQSIQSICASLGFAIDAILQKPMAESQQEELMRVGRRVCELMIISGMTAIYHIKECFEGKTMFHMEPDGTLVIFFRSAFANCLESTLRLWSIVVISHLCNKTNFANDNPLFTDQPYPDRFLCPVEPWEGDITVALLEKALYGPTNVLSHSLVTTFINPEKVESFLPPLYNMVVKHRTLRESLDTFILLKLIIISIILMSNFDENLDAIRHGTFTADMLVSSTKEKMERFSKDVLDEKLQLNVADDDVQEMIASLFDTDVTPDAFSYELTNDPFNDLFTM